MRVLVAAVIATFAGVPPAFAGLDRDGLLTEAPATPAQSTVRIAGFGVAELESRGGQSVLNGNVMWAPIENLALDVGVFADTGANAGPTARVRYQLLAQEGTGVDLSAGMRFKTIGFHPDQGEVEFLLAAGKSFGHFDLILNGVLGFETGGESGKDIEGRLFAGYRFGESIRAGVDGRFRTEVEDEAAVSAAKVGRDFDLTAGPAFSWLPTDSIQIQALVGVSAPKRSELIGPAAMLFGSVDF